MTPEEQAYLQALALQRQQLMADPMARAANDYGQGSGFLGLDTQPESWDRIGEVNDIYRDVLGTTGIKFEELVPGLYPEVEDPGQYTGYRSDMAAIYGSNPAFQEIAAAIDEGGDVYEVLDLAARNPRFQQFLPKDENGQVDRTAFTTDATKFLSERARETSERGQYDSRVQEFRDFVDPQSAWTAAPGVEDITSYLRPKAVAPRQSTAAVASVPSRGGGGTTGVAGAVDQVGNRIEGLFDPNKRGPRETTGRIGDLGAADLRRTVAAGAPNASSNILAATRARAANDVAEKNRVNDAYNQALQDAYMQMRGRKEASLRPSKQQERNARLLNAYNVVHYGEG